MIAPARLSKARAQLLMDQPFLAGLLMRLKLKSDPTCNTMWTDGIHIGYNPQFVSSLQILYLKALLAHETLHCAMQHFSRRKGRATELWNAACDYVINLLLIEQGFTLPDAVLVNERFRGMDVDTVYSILSKEQNEQDPDNLKAANWGEVREPKIPPGRNIHLDREWQKAWKESRMIAQKQGILPGSLDRAVTQALKAKVPWREALAVFLTSYAKSDYSFARPNRRYLHHSLYLPSMSQPCLEELVVAVDTSGSVDQKQLDAFAAEIQALLQQLQPKQAYILLCDAAIQEIITYDPSDAELKLPLKGGGGTSFKPVFKWAENQANATLLVYLTDLWGTFPEPPDFPVLWVLPGTAPFHPPFGDVLSMI